MDSAVLDFYRTQGRVTGAADPLPFPSGLDPRGVRDLVCRNIIHIHCAGLFGVALPPGRRAHADLLLLSDRMAAMRRLGFSDFESDKPPGTRIAGTCRDFAVTAAWMLRESGYPARARCGFAAYFEKDKWIDHWIVEYWDGSRWTRMDAQLEERMERHFGLAFDFADMPAEVFLDGPEAWIGCRDGRFDPSLFGLFDMFGMDYVKSNLLLDVASLFKDPMLPWSYWEGIKKTPCDGHPPADWAFLDKTAALAAIIDGNFTELEALYESDGGLRPPDDLDSVGSYIADAGGTL